MLRGFRQGQEQITGTSQAARFSTISGCLSAALGQSLPAAFNPFAGRDFGLSEKTKTLEYRVVAELFRVCKEQFIVAIPGV